MHVIVQIDGKVSRKVIAKSLKYYIFPGLMEKNI